MRKKIRIPLLSVCLSMLLCGCSLWMDGQYHNVRPHREENVEVNIGTVEVRSYTDLRLKLEELVERGQQSGMIYLTGGSEQHLQMYMEMARTHILTNNAIGAYAVDEISYQVGTSGTRPAVAVIITYLHDSYEILRIKQAETMEQAVELITDSLDNCEHNVVFKVNAFEERDFVQLVQDHVDENPQSCMEMPQVTAAVYPDSGTERVIELNFTYQTSTDTLRDMQSAVRQIFASARLYVGEAAEPWEKCAQLYSFLMERYKYKIDTSITPSYSLLHHGVGDSKAFATVYAAMCRQVGLSCKAVSGTKAGEPWHWNVLLIDGVYYHVDLLRCSAGGSFFAKRDSEMDGYVWNYSDFEQQLEDVR